jgi:hypothetical protein
MVVADDLNAINRFYMVGSPSPTTTDMALTPSLVRAAWIHAGSLQAMHDADVTLVRVDVTCLTTPTAGQATGSFGDAGTNSGNPLPPGTALVIKFKTPRRYRGGHPRAYMTGLIREGMTNPSEWLPAYMANWATAWSTFIGQLVATTPGSINWSGQVNISYFAGFHNVTYPSGRVRSVPTLRAVPVIDSVLSYSVNPRPASQRRRNLQSA